MLAHLLDRLRPSLTKSRLLTFAAVLLALLPFVVMARLVYLHAVDTPFNDDWTFLEDWMDWTEGKLSLGDLFTAHMEHRVTVARIMALLLHGIGGGDLRWQIAFTALLLLGMGWNLVVLLRRTSGLSLADLWLPLLLMSSALFCTIQWQGLLWPILFEAYIPIFCLTLSLRVWCSEMKPWAAFAISALGTMAGMWSFGNGMTAWALVPVLFWTCRTHMTKRQRWQFTGIWLVLAAAAAVLYSLNFGNAAPSQFSYGQGTEVTAGHSVGEFFKKLPEAPRFVTALLGSHLSRGLHLDNLLTAEVMGWLSLLVFAFALLELWRGRQDQAWVQSLVPWILLGLFSIGSAVLIAAGRLWLSKSGTLAITVRYVSHAIPLTVALIAQVYLLGRRWTQTRSLGMALSGAFLMLLATQWIYGAQNMKLWAQCRWQGRALLMFAKVHPNSDALGPVAGDGGYVRPLALRMQQLGLMSPPLLPDLKLKNFQIVNQELPLQRAGFQSLELKPDGVTMVANGYSELPSQRPADLVLFTTGKNTDEATIFALGLLESVPRFWYDATKKDREFLAIPNFTQEWTARWAGPLAVISKPKPDDHIQAWALDASRSRVFRIADERLPSGSFFPNLKH